MAPICRKFKYSFQAAQKLNFKQTFKTDDRVAVRKCPILIIDKSEQCINNKLILSLGWAEKKNNSGHLDVVFADRVPDEHGVERGDLVNSHPATGSEVYVKNSISGNEHLMGLIQF